MREIFLGMLGLCMGTTIASGVVAFIISLGIVPRFAGITGSAAQVRLYEECSMLGAVLGNVVFLYQRALPLGNPGLAVYGSFSGIFLGSWVVALGEVVNIYAILIRRIGLVKGIGLVSSAWHLEKWWVLFGFSFSDGRSITEKMINPGIKPGSPEDTECVRNEKQKKDR